MGEVTLFTKEQKDVFDFVASDDFLNSHFYFTGGTALSIVHLKHRYSDDLDFFSEIQFNPQVVFQKIQAFAKSSRAELRLLSIEETQIFDLTFKNHARLKVDFAYYPYKRLKKGTKFNGVETDSLLDIATNKILSISQRTEIKDFVDLYFLLKRFSTWDLIRGVEIKFGAKLEPFVLASDFLRIEEFDFLPRMIRPMTMEKLHRFFREQAKKLGRQSVE